MTQTELETILRQIGWSRRELSRRIGVPEPTIRMTWKTVPSPYDRWIRRVAAAMERLPPPKH